MVGLFLPAALALLPALASAAAAQGLESGPIRRVTTEEPAVAITFDACATKSHGYGFDHAIFDIIKNERVPATIFVSGRWVEAHPDAMEELVHDPLIEFGDHSYDHPHMSDLAPELIAAQIDEAEAALAKYGKKSVAFRPPFGEWSRRLVQVARDRRLPTVTWDVVSGDPSEGTTAEWMIHSVVTRARPGSIVVFHINGRGWKTAEALPGILRGLRGRGFHFVPLSGLLAAGSPMPAAVAMTRPAAATPAAPRPTPTPVAAAKPHAEAPTVIGRAPLRSIVTANPYAAGDDAHASMPWPPPVAPPSEATPPPPARPLEPVH